MSLKTPTWWYKKDGRGAPWWWPVMWPLSLIWQLVNAIKRATAKPYRSSLRVISVGNLTLGGSGKTPVTAEILRLLEVAGIRAIGLSKGYGGTLHGPVMIDPVAHLASQVGDEALMLAQDHPFMIAKDRTEGLKAREKDGTEVVVVDDAHQNLAIAKDVNILVIDGDTRNGAWPFGNGGICPYGPLREPFAQGLNRTDICILWMPDANTPPNLDLVKLLKFKVLHVARLIVLTEVITQKVVGFAAIAKPWKFETTLCERGFEVVDFTGFPDHAALSIRDLETLETRAATLGARLITTQKDWIKLDPIWRNKVLSLDITARFDDPDLFVADLMAALEKPA